MREHRLSTALYQKWKNWVVCRLWTQDQHLLGSAWTESWERPASANSSLAWDVTFPTRHSCLRQTGLLSAGHSLAQIVSILFTAALSKLDQEPQFSMLGFYFILSTSWPINSFPAAMKCILRPELFNHLLHPCHVINNSILLHPDPAPASLLYALIYEENFSDVQWWLQETAR